MIRVARNAAGNCVIFHGQTNPVYFNACLTAEIIDTDYVSIRNDISTGLGDPKYEYYRIHYTEWQSEDFGTFDSATEAVEYINSIGNVHDATGSGTSFSVGETLDFVVDETQTSILLSNGDHHGVNALHAVAKDNGRVGIETPVGEVEWYEIDFEDVTINGTSAGNNLNAVVNALNALFTVTALGAATPAPVYTLQGGDDGTWLNIQATTPAGGTAGEDFMFGTGGQYHGPRVYTTETIDEPGEYWTFEVENVAVGGGPLIGIGLYDATTDVTGNPGEADDLEEIEDTSLSNSGHHGYWFSTWLYNYTGYTAPWTTYGSHSSLSYGAGWNGPTSQQFRYSDVHDAFRDGGTALFRCGITDSGFVGIWYYDAEVEGYGGGGARSNDWILCARSSTPVPAGQYGLLVKLASTSVRVRSVPTRFAVDPVAPTLYPRFIESPDGVFHYPLYASAEEANYVDTQNGGGGTSHTHVYVDEPTYTTWYMPTNGGLMAQSAAPADPTYTEIPTEADSLHGPSAFSDTTLNVDEGAAINYPVAPVDANYTTSVTGLPAGLTYDPLTHSILGSAPQVAGDNVANPSDDYALTVTRSNAYGSSQGTLTITVANLTAPATAIAGFTHVAGTTALVDSDTLDDGSAVTFDNTVDVGKRFIIPQAWVETYVLPAIQASGDAIYLGITDGAADLTTSIEDADFDAYIKWEYQTSTSHASTIVAGGSSSMYGIGSRTVSLYDYAFELDGTDVHVIACNFNDINTQPGVENGGSFSRVVSTTASGSQTLTLAAVSTQMDFAGGTIVEIDLPLGSTTFLVTEQNESTALFDGSTTLPTLNAGTTYRFMLDASIHSDDTLTFETLDGTAYTTGVTTVGTHGDYLYYVQFAVPGDVPPIRAVWNDNDQNTFTISGSTYTTTVTGITLEGPAANQTGTNVMDQNDHGWISLDEQLSAGERLVMDNAFWTDFLAELNESTNMFAIGLKGDNWTNTKEVNAVEAASTGEFFKGDTYIVGQVGGGNYIWFRIYSNGVASNQMLVNTTALHSTVCAFLEITSSGNNIRAAFGRNGDLSVAQGDESTVAYADWSSYKGQTGDQGYGITSQDVVASFWTYSGGDIDGANIDWTGLSEISVPTPAATLTTPWTKALDFSGGAERTLQVTNDSNRCPIRMSGVNNNAAGNATAGYTSNDANARPWATAIVFKADTYNDNQHVWNQGEGAGTTDDNIYLRRDANRNLWFGWGRTGSELNECYVGNIGGNISGWWGVYIASTGERLGSGHSAADIADCFDIRIVNLQTGATGTNLSTEANWTSGSFGARMNRQILGDFTVGGRGSNRSFRGKVASMVVTTMRRNVAMPTDAEISMMVRDPKQWMTDYKAGNAFRLPWQGTDAGFNWSVNDGSSSYATQVWLMGDGTGDAYAQIRNQVWAATQTYTPLNMISMVSNDIETVTINGLS